MYIYQLSVVGFAYIGYSHTPPLHMPPYIAPPYMRFICALYALHMRFVFEVALRWRLGGALLPVSLHSHTNCAYLALMRGGSMPRKKGGKAKPRAALSFSTTGIIYPPHDQPFDFAMSHSTSRLAMCLRRCWYRQL